MTRSARLFVAAIAVVGLAAINGFAFAPAEENGQDPKGQTHGSESEGKKRHNDYSGKALLGANIKQNGSHKLQGLGKYSASVSVSSGKITGMSVRHADKGSVAVTKYKTTRNMARGATSGVQFASYFLAQSRYVGTMWIGYGYLDEWGDEYIYWFPYDMIYEGDTDAIEYVPAN